MRTIKRVGVDQPPQCDTYFDPLVLRLIGLLQKALPDAKPEDLFWAFQFTSGAYTLILSRTGRIDRLSDGLCRSDDLRAVRERFVTSMAGGFSALYNARKTTRRKSPKRQPARKAQKSRSKSKAS